MLTSNKHRQDAKEIERMIMNQHDWQPGQYIDKFGKPYHMEGPQRLYYYMGNGKRVTCLKYGTVLPYMTND